MMHIIIIKVIASTTTADICLSLVYKSNNIYLFFWYSLVDFDSTSGVANKSLISLDLALQHCLKLVIS